MQSDSDTESLTYAMTDCRSSGAVSLVVCRRPTWLDWCHTLSRDCHCSALPRVARNQWIWTQCHLQSQVNAASQLMHAVAYSHNSPLLRGVLVLVRRGFVMGWLTLAGLGLGLVLVLW